MNDEAHNRGRREFLRGLARGGALGLLVLGTGGLVARGRGECARDGVCGGCPALGGCALPPAATHRQARGETRGDDGR